MTAAQADAAVIDGVLVQGERDMATTVTAATTAAVMTIGATSLAPIAICTLLVLLTKKTIVEATDYSWAPRLGKVLDIAIVPLLVVFFATVTMKVLSASR
ncbi:MAG: hypothetical protein AVDCRST_MAG26-4646 [uncultured Chloroflexia bacterium]|uniref:Uncharacterized protein n=1 Tax=uncultured Chloroflexia bacterium TaxID=1672391 RepID=A0A6J4K8Y8_9CHLR|nr:MAG: hypothetical protein AVDCRST_MAG26-4646 [uncultured Chloroflexia bacterium]